MRRAQIYFTEKATPALLSGIAQNGRRSSSEKTRHFVIRRSNDRSMLGVADACVVIESPGNTELEGRRLSMWMVHPQP